MPEICLQRPGVVALIGQHEAACMPEHVRMCLEAKRSATPALSTIRAKPAVPKGASRSDVKANGDFGS